MLQPQVAQHEAVGGRARPPFAHWCDRPAHSRASSTSHIDTVTRTRKKGMRVGTHFFSSFVVLFGVHRHAHAHGSPARGQP